ncbi:tape measure protein [Weissella tructae]|uniref:tape measure protein n=1 Tax=Weissella tructae TaxID=887702 RepID=UPI003D8A674A
MADGLVTIAVELQDGSVVKGVANINKGMTGLEQTGGRAGKSMIGFGAVTGAAMALAQKGLSAVTNSVGAAVDRFDTLNQYPKVMKQMGYSTEDTSKSIDIMKKGIDGLPTTLPEITKMSQNFATLTGSATKGSKSAVALSHAFLASGASAADASRGTQQFSQMLASGKVDMQSWQSLQETMPYALDKTAKAMGFTGKAAKQDLYKALQDGDVTMDQFLDKIIELDQGVDGFGETAKLSSKGIKTSFQNMNNAVVAGLADMLKAIDDGLKNAGLQDGIATLFDGMKTIIVDTFKFINEFIRTKIPPIIQLIKELVDFVANNKDWLLPLVAGVGGFYVVIKAAFALKRALTVIKVASAVANDVKLLGFALENMSKQSMLAKAGLMIYNVATKAVTGAQAALNAVLALNPWVLVIAGITAVVAALTYFFTQTETGKRVWASFTEWFTGVWNGMKSAVQSFVSWLDSTWQTMTGGNQGVWQSFVTWFSTTWETIKSVAQSAIDPIKMAFSAMGEALEPLKQAFSDVVEAIKPMLSGFDGAGGSAQGAMNIFKTVAPIVLGMAFPFINVIRVVGQFIKAFQETGSASEAVNVVAENFSNMAENIMGIIGQIIDVVIANLPQILQTGIQILSTLIEGIVTMLPALIEMGVNLLVQLINGIISVLPTIIDTAVSIILALVNGIVAMLPSIIETGVKLLVTLVEAILSMLPQLIEAAVRLVIGLVTGLIQALPQLLAAGVKLIVALVGAIIQLVPTLLSAGVKLIAALIRGVLSLIGALLGAGGQLISGLIGAIVGFIGNMVSSGAQLISGVIDGISGKIGNVVSTVSGGISDAVAGVRGFAGDMFNAAADLANGLVNGITSKIGEVVDAAKNMAKGAVDGAKSFLGIHSPSRVFRDQVGKFIPEGLAVGIDRNARVAVASMESLSDKISSIKPEPVFDMGAMGGFTTANGIIEHQLSRNASVSDDKTGNVANVNVTNYVQANPSEAEQARLMKNTMRQMGYDSVY